VFELEALLRAVEDAVETASVLLAVEENASQLIELIELMELQPSLDGGEGGTGPGAGSNTAPVLFAELLGGGEAVREVEVGGTGVAVLLGAGVVVVFVEEVSEVVIEDVGVD